MKLRHSLHYQEDLNLHHMKIKIILDIQIPFIVKNAVLAVHHLSKPEMNLAQPHVCGITTSLHGGILSKETTSHTYQTV